MTFRAKVVSFASATWTASIRLDGSAAQTLEQVGHNGDLSTAADTLTALEGELPGFMAACAALQARYGG